MVLEFVLLFFLLATVVLGIRLHFDIKKLSHYKDDFNKILKKTELTLTDLENTTERFRYILNTEKEALHRLIHKAQSAKEELMFLDQSSSKKQPVQREPLKLKDSPKVQFRRRNIVQNAPLLR